MGILDAFQVLAERSDLCMAKLDADRRVVDVSGELARRFGRSPEALRGRHFLELCHAGVGRLVEIALRGEPGTLVVMVPEDAEVGEFRLGEVDARILEGIANGESTVRIAGRLFLSRQGVEYHVGAMLRRLGVPNRAALVSKAFSMGLFNVAAWPPRVRPAFVR